MDSFSIGHPVTVWIKWLFRFIFYRVESFLKVRQCCEWSFVQLANYSYVITRIMVFLAINSIRFQTVSHKNVTSELTWTFVEFPSR